MVDRWLALGLITLPPYLADLVVGSQVPTTGGPEYPVRSYGSAIQDWARGLVYQGMQGDGCCKEGDSG